MGMLFVTFFHTLTCIPTSAKRLGLDRGYEVLRNASLIVSLSVLEDESSEAGEKSLSVFMYAYCVIQQGVALT